jgi:hydrogenase nickel incorporation protein HypA/HybF
MHELSIVLSIVDQVEQIVQQNKAKTVSKIELDIGALAGIEWTSFDFAWKPATKNSSLEHAELVVHRIPGQATCSDCGTRFEKRQLFDPCPSCQGYLHALDSGKELKIKTITLN